MKAPTETVAFHQISSPLSLTRLHYKLLCWFLSFVLDYSVFLIIFIVFSSISGPIYQVMFHRGSEILSRKLLRALVRLGHT
jgi:hypothetical protein